MANIVELIDPDYRSPHSPAVLLSSKNVKDLKVKNNLNSGSEVHYYLERLGWKTIEWKGQQLFLSIEEPKEC